MKHVYEIYKFANSWELTMTEHVIKFAMEECVRLRSAALKASLGELSHSKMLDVFYDANTRLYRYEDLLVWHAYSSSVEVLQHISNIRKEFWFAEKKLRASKNFI